MLTPKKKITKKELKHDPLLDTIERSQEFYDQNSKQILTGLGAALVIVLLLWGWMNSRESYRSEVMLADTKTSIAAMQGINDNIISELELVVAEYGSNELSAMSTLQLGEARMQAGDNEGARDLFNGLASSSDPQLKAAAKLKLAYLAEKEADFAGAAQLYSDVGNMDLSSVSQLAKLQAGYAFAASGDENAARSIVSELMADEPTGRFREQVKYLEGKVQEK